MLKLKNILFTEDLGKYLRRQNGIDYATYINDDADYPVDTFHISDESKWKHHPCYMALINAKNYFRSDEFIDKVFEDISSGINFDEYVDGEIDLSSVIEDAIEQIIDDDIKFQCLENKKVKTSVYLNVDGKETRVVYVIDKNNNVNEFFITLENNKRLREQYEFIIHEKNSIWKVTLCGINALWSIWDKTSLPAHLTDMKSEGMIKGAIDVKWNGEFLNNAKILYYFDDEDKAENFYKYLRTYYTNNELRGKNNSHKIEQVDSINENIKRSIKCHSNY